jgi:hypothetical protein
MAPDKNLRPLGRMSVLEAVLREYRLYLGDYRKIIPSLSLSYQSTRALRVTVTET